MEEKIDISEYQYLWDGSEEGWGLCRCADDEEGNLEFIIFNSITSMALIIEDDVEYHLVQAEMLKRNLIIKK